MRRISLLFAVLVAALGLALPVQARSHKQNINTEESTEPAQTAPAAAPVAGLDAARAMVDAGRYGEAAVALAPLANGLADSLAALQASFYLGICQDKMGNKPAALALFRKVLAAVSDEAVKQQASAHLNELLADINRFGAALYAERERQLAAAGFTASDGSRVGLAVLPCATLGNDPSLGTLGQGVADLLSADLAQIEGLFIVDRTHIDQLVGEMQLGATGILRQDTAPKAGRMLAAGEFVGSSLLALAQEQIRLDGTLVSARDCKVLDSRNTQGALAEIFDLERALCNRVVQGLGVQLTPAEQAARGQHCPTQSNQAVRSLFDGFDAYRKDNLGEARQKFTQSHNADPNFGCPMFLLGELAKRDGDAKAAADWKQQCAQKCSPGCVTCRMLDYYDRRRKEVRGTSAFMILCKAIAPCLDGMQTAEGPKAAATEPEADDPEHRTRGARSRGDVRGRDSGGGGSHSGGGGRSSGGGGACR